MLVGGVKTGQDICNTACKSLGYDTIPYGGDTDWPQGLWGSRGFVGLRDGRQKS